MATTKEQLEIINAWGEASFLEAAPRDIVIKVLKLSSLNEIADAVGCCSSALMHRLRKGKVQPTVKVGERYYFTEDEVKKAVQCWESRVRLLPESKWTEEMVTDIRQRWLRGETQASIALSYNSNQSTISHIIKGVRIRPAKEVAAAHQSLAPSTAPSSSAPSQSAA